MTSSELTVILSSLTAMAAVIAPAVSTVLTNRSNERINRDSIHYPRIHDALKEMSNSYSIMKMDCQTHHDASFFSGMWATRYGDFLKTSYLVVSLISSNESQQQIIDLVDSLGKARTVSSQHDEEFSSIMRAVSLELSGGKSAHRSSKHNKNKAKSSK